MLEKLNDMPAGIDGLKASGRLSKEDYELVVEPLLDRARRDGRRVRLLFEVGPQFEGFAASEGWEDARMGLRYMRLFDACAIVTDLGWVRESTRLARFMMPCPVRAFGDQERGKAIEWLSSVPEGAAISFHLQADSGVIVVELKEALRAHDFDALAFTTDTWFEAHGKLRGVVIHCREFPGWENLRSVIRHLRFMRDHHRKVERVALAAGSKLASLIPHITEHFVEAEIKSFRFDELDAAIAWARGSGDQKAAGRVSAVETRA